MEAVHGLWRVIDINWWSMIALVRVITLMIKYSRHPERVLSRTPAATPAAGVRSYSVRKELVRANIFIRYSNTDFILETYWLSSSLQYHTWLLLGAVLNGDLHYTCCLSPPGGVTLDLDEMTSVWIMDNEDGEIAIVLLIITVSNPCCSTKRVMRYYRL